MRSTCIALIALLALPSNGHAQNTVFSTFGPGNSYDTTPGFGSFAAYTDFNGPGLDVWNAVSFSYSGPAGGTLSQIRFVGGQYNGRAGAMRMDLVRGRDFTSATLLESWIVTGQGADNTVSMYSLTSALNTQLVQGETYWLMTRPASGTAAAWLWSFALLDNPDQSSRAFSTNSGASWFGPYGPEQREHAFDVSVNVVPEPGTVSLLGGGMLVMAVLRRRQRRRAVRALD